MNEKQLSAATRVLGFVPKHEATVALVVSVIKPASTDVPGLFQADGIEIQFDGGESLGGISLWLTLPDAKALAAHLQAVIDRLSSWPLP